MNRPKKKAIPDLKALASLDDAPLTAKDLASMRPLRDVFPDLAEWSRKRKRARKKAARIRRLSVFACRPKSSRFRREKGPAGKLVSM